MPQSIEDKMKNTWDKHVTCMPHFFEENLKIVVIRILELKRT